MPRKQLEILMPMAGLGQRYRDQGVQTPKPLINLSGTPFFQHALNSLKIFFSDARVSFLICAEDQLESPLENSLQGSEIKYQVVEIPFRTKGPAHTLLQVAPFIQKENPCIALDCDLSFSSPPLFQEIQKNLRGEGVWDGGLTTFQAEEAKYSFVCQDETGRVLKIAEKQPISSHAVVGAYYFKKAKDLFWAAEKTLNLSGEVYVSHAIQHLLDEGKKFKAHTVEDYVSFGTPEELKELSPTL